MSLYYIHKVGHQEMGSVKTPDDTPSRGRYFLISKACLDFFPHISSVVLNDKIILSIIPMKEGTAQKKVYCTMDYHNQKFALISYDGNNPRNEIRLYMNNDIDPDRKFFFKEDLAVFEKFFVNGETVYSLTKISPVQDEYQELRSLLESKDRRFQSNLIFDGELNFIKKPNIDEVTGVVFTEEAKKVIRKEAESVIQTEDESGEEERSDMGFEEGMGSSFFNATLFRDLVMNAYRYKCAITGRAIRYEELLNLEAAHIKAKAHQGTFLPCNGIAMSRDMHFAFDKGFFTITDDYKVMVSENLRGDWFYDEYNGKQIYVPTEDFYKPKKEYLAHHRREVFNTFKQIRRIS